MSFEDKLREAKKHVEWLYSVGMISDEPYYDVIFNIDFVIKMATIS